MSEIPRRKSPRAPSMALDEALERALKAYDRDRLHPAPTELFAQNIGYKGANNGSALQAMASMRYYGLIERPKEGLLAVSKDVESYKFAPDDAMRNDLLLSFIKRPPLFAELLDKYGSGLPSDANLRYELIQRGFVPQGAEAALSAFKKSVEYVGYFSRRPTPVDVAAADFVSENRSSDNEEIQGLEPPALVPASSTDARLQKTAMPSQSTHIGDDDLDRIPVRLPGARRAWLLIPTPFFSADKLRLKAQIDLLLTEDEE